jgi:hypothetical protein
MADQTACNVDFCAAPSDAVYFTLEALEVWIH